MKKASEFMIADHKNLNRLWDDFLAEKDSVMAKNLFQKFSNRLDKHFTMEEDVLFPLFNKQLGLEKNVGAVALSQHEHEELRRILGRIKTLLDENDSRRIENIGIHFKRALIKHQEKENSVQYSLFDNFIVIPDEEWENMCYDVFIK